MDDIVSGKHLFCFRFCKRIFGNLGCIDNPKGFQQLFHQSFCFFCHAVRGIGGEEDGSGKIAECLPHLFPCCIRVLQGSGKCVKRTHVNVNIHTFQFVEFLNGRFYGVKHGDVNGVWIIAAIREDVLVCGFEGVKYRFQLSVELGYGLGDG